MTAPTPDPVYDYRSTRHDEDWFIGGRRVVGFAICLGGGLLGILVRPGEKCFLCEARL